MLLTTISHPEMSHHPEHRSPLSSSSYPASSASRQTIAHLPASTTSADISTISHTPSTPMRLQRLGQRQRNHHLFGQQPTLPPEIWAHIFQEATAIHNFFDTRWDSCRNSIFTPFDEAISLASSPISSYYSSSSSSSSSYYNTSSASIAPATFACSLRE